jgi:hypothetical protein
VIIVISVEKCRGGEVIEVLSMRQAIYFGLVTVTEANPDTSKQASESTTLPVSDSTRPTPLQAIKPDFITIMLHRTVEDASTGSDSDYSK